MSRRRLYVGRDPPVRRRRIGPACEPWHTPARYRVVQSKTKAMPLHNLII